MDKSTKPTSRAHRTSIFAEGSLALDKKFTGSMSQQLKMRTSLAMNEQLEVAADLRKFIAVVEIEIENIEGAVSKGEILSGDEMAESMIRLKNRLNMTFEHAATAFMEKDNKSRADFVQTFMLATMFGSRR